MEDRFEALSTQISNLEKAMLAGFAAARDYMEFLFSQERVRTGGRFDRLETRMDRFESRVEHIESDVSEIKTSIKRKGSTQR